MAMNGKLAIHAVNMRDVDFDGDWDNTDGYTIASHYNDPPCSVGPHFDTNDDGIIYYGDAVYPIGGPQDSTVAIPRSGIGNPYAFTGQRLDTMANPLNAGDVWYHYRAREYDSKNGRFLQRDPLLLDPERNGYHDGMSLYEYVKSNPIKNTDSSGNVVDQILIGNDTVTIKFSIVFWGRRAFENNPSVGAKSVMIDVDRRWNKQVKRVKKSQKDCICRKIIFQFNYTKWKDTSEECHNLPVPPTLLADSKVIECESRARAATGMKNSMWVRPEPGGFPPGGATGGYLYAGVRATISVNGNTGNAAHEMGHLMGSGELNNGDRTNIMNQYGRDTDASGHCEHVLKFFDTYAFLKHQNALKNWVCCPKEVGIK